VAALVDFMVSHIGSIAPLLGTGPIRGTIYSTVTATGIKEKGKTFYITVFLI